MNIRNFALGFGGALFSNIYITQRNTYRYKDGSPVQDPIERQAIPITLGVGAFFYGLYKKDSMALGFAVGMACIQTARYVTGCYDAKTPSCEFLTFAGLGIR